MKICNKTTLQLSQLIIIAIVIQSCIFNEKDTGEQKTKQPNIIFIMSDDHAVTAISVYGNSVNQTPNIDRLAIEGIMFNQSFCTNAICAPVRAVILTGKYSHINGHIDNGVTFDGNQQTFPKLLQHHNYQTAMIGKWHLKSDPTGFDYWNILPGQGSYYNPDFIEMGEKKKYEGYVTDLITKKTIDWLNKRDTTKAFCLMMHHKAPHRTWMPNINHLNDFDTIDIPLPPTFFDDYKNRGTAAKTQKMSIWKDMYLGYDLKLTRGLNSTEIIDDLGIWSFKRMNSKQRNAWDSAYQKKNNDYHKTKPKDKDLARWKYRRYMEDYLGTIESVDESVGEILDYLDKNGLTENTIVVYTSDQGFYLGEHGWFDKRFMYEESLKIPLIVRYPKEIAKGQISDNMVLNLDFAPTFLDYAGIDIPDDIQGESIRQVLKGETPAGWRKEVYYHYYEYPRGGHAVKRHYGIRTHNYKLIHYYFDIDEWELFDLANDPHELNNLYNNPKYSSKIGELKVKLTELRKKYKDDNQDSFLPDTSSKRINHKAVGATVLLTYPHSTKYTGNSKNALIDGNISIDDLSQIDDKEVWQGFEETDLVATIDLGEELEIGFISAGFLQNIDAWIFSPEWVEFSISNNNESFQIVDKVDRMIPVKSTKEQRVSYSVKTPKTKIRYIRVHAKNIAKCPRWHKGAGSKAWLFVDEIIVN
ncbi:MAG: sulfatase [Bacteroidales bacterium]|nr:sulfatase [Bacteroidales bacterium]